MSVMQQPTANIPSLVFGSVNIFTSVLHFSSLKIAAEERRGGEVGGGVAAGAGVIYGMTKCLCGAVA